MAAIHRSLLRRWRWIAGGGVAIAVTGLMVVQFAGARAWQDTVAWADAEQQRWQQIDFHRPACWGEAMPGSAFAAYERAAALLQAESDLGDRITRELRLRDADPAERAAALVTLGPALADLRQGAHAGDARDPVDWSAGFSVAIPNLLSYRALVNAGQARAYQLVAQGDDVEAVRVMLDGGQCGRDLMQSPLLITQMIGCALLAIATNETADAELLDELSPSALAELHRGLEVLDENLPLAPVMPHSEAVLLVRTLETDGGALLEECGLAWASSWRYGFSGRLMLASGVEQLAEFYGECGRGLSLPWPDARKTLDEAYERVKGSGNPFVAMATPNMASAESSRREAVAVLRLLRTDVAHRLGRELKLEDPTGNGFVRVLRESDGVHFQCAAERRGAPLERVAQQ